MWFVAHLQESSDGDASRAGSGASPSIGTAVGPVWTPDKSVAESCLSWFLTSTVTSFHSMGEGDDPQTFDKVFQATAEACFWLKEEWVMRLLQVLSCKTPAAVLSLTAAARNSFKDVCQVVVNHWDSHLGIIRTNLSPMPSFMSRTLKEPYELLDIKPVWTSTYHPQTEGLVEWLNKT